MPVAEVEFSSRDAGKGQEERLNLHRTANGFGVSSEVWMRLSD
jgi:hypothetical protein